MKENLGNNLPIQNAHDNVRNMVEEKTGYKPEKVNLRPALEKSLATKAYVEDFISDFIPEYKNYNSRQQMVLEEYVLLADLLKRKLWDEINLDIEKLLNDSEFINYPFPGNPELKELTTIRKEKERHQLTWEETADIIQKIIAVRMGLFLDGWEERMKKEETDEMYQQRFGELELIMNKQKKLGMTLKSPANVISSGLNTGISFPMGLLKNLPDLIRAQGELPTKEKIMELFEKNMQILSVKYAAQDLMTFGVLDEAVNPRSPTSTEKPANFSSQLFTLDEVGKVTFKKDAFEALHPQINKSIEESYAEEHSVKNHILSTMENKPIRNDGKSRSPWKTCPALFAKLLLDYDKFFKPIAERFLETQEEYK